MVAAVAIALLTGGRSDPPVDRVLDPEEQAEALLAYERALEPLAFDAGRIVVEGLRPALGDLFHGEVPAERMAETALGWAEELETLRDEMAGVEAPDFLSEAAALFDQAMAGYVEVARAVVETAMAPRAEWEDRLAAAADDGERADALWDQGRAVLDEHRERLGVTEPSPFG